MDPQDRAAVDAAVAAQAGTQERPPPWLDVTTALQFMTEDGNLVFHAVSVLMPCLTTWKAWRRLICEGHLIICAWTITSRATYQRLSCNIKAWHLELSQRLTSAASSVLRTGSYRGWVLSSAKGLLCKGFLLT